MCDKNVCKYCEKLRFYDWYYCEDDDISNITNNWYITDIEVKTCKNFIVRNGRFWNYKGAEF
jgi:hypothetical protein